MFKPKFMDSEYVETVPMDKLKENAPMRIKELYKKYIDNERMTTFEINELSNSKYFVPQPGRWVAKPGAPPEIIKELNCFNKFVLEEEIDATSDENNSFTKP